MNINIYHVNEPTFREVDKVKANQLFMEAKLVAKVIAGNLDVAFRDTNHIDCLWWNNENVIAQPPKNFRSTSVGDFMVTRELDDIVYYQVMSFGFEEFARFSN